MLDFVDKDDARILAEEQLEQAKLQMEQSKLQTALLQQVAAQTKGSLNDYVTVIELDMGKTHDSYEVYRWRDGDPRINSVVILPQLVDYSYELESGVRVPIDAGLIMDVTGHKIDMLWITNTSTVGDVMKMVLSGVRE